MKTPTRIPPPPRHRRRLLVSSLLGRPSRKASSLVTALLVLVVLSTITVAFMQSMSIERLIAKSLANKTRAILAAESGLSAALARFSNLNSPNFVVAQDRSAGSPETWPLVLYTLDSDGTPVATNSMALGTPALGNHTFKFATNYERKTPLHSLVDSESQTNGAFAFTVIANTSKQYLGSAAYPTTNRLFAITRNELPIILTNLVSLNPTQTGIWNALANNSSTSQLLTTSSYNQFFSAANSPDFSDRWADLSAWASSAAPSGKEKVDLRRLKYYLDSLSISQSSGNPKSQVVEALLGLPSSVSPSSWGNGTLAWLISPKNPHRYSNSEGRQIIANLVDYLDEDLHPTTDNVDSPTYFGVEGRFRSDGKVQGHPVATSIGHGLVFNLSGASGYKGWLNSTRVLTFWSLVNPWSADIQNLFGFYSIELEIEVLGNATGGLLGPSAQSYFNVILNERLNEGNSTLNAYSGSTYPQSPSGFSYANFKSFQPANRQPKGMSFQNIQFRIKKGRLKFTDTSNLSSYVQVLDGLKATPVSMNPSSFTLPSPSWGTSVVYRPGNVRNALFLNNDFRLGFRADSWKTGQLTTGEAASSGPPGIGVVQNIFSSMNSTQGDGIQGVNTNFLWYKSSALTNHLFVRSPQKITNNPASVSYNRKSSPVPQELAVESIAELGYIFSGRPWQTLRMVETNNLSKRADYKILDYISPGTFAQTNLTQFPIPSQVGLVNISEGLNSTFQSLFTNIPNISNPTNFVDFLRYANATVGYPYLSPGELGANTNFQTPSASTKFARESLMRSIANIITTRSDEFTVLSYGEARDPLRPNRIVSKAKLAAKIRIVSNPKNNLPIPIVISKIIE